MFWVLKLVYDILEFVLDNRELYVLDLRIKIFLGCYVLFKFVEFILNRVYVWVFKFLAVYIGLFLEVRG